MDLSLTYIASQIFVVLSYIFLMLTYFVKSRKTLLVISFASLIAVGISFFLLSAYTGLAMVFVAIIRNLIFLRNDKKAKTNKITKKDILILIVLSAVSIIFAKFTYTGFLSLLSVFATMLYTYSVWQKNTIVYKILGIPISLIWIAYNIYIFSIFGIICESSILISAIIGFIKSKNKLFIKKWNEVFNENGKL